MLPQSADADAIAALTQLEGTGGGVGDGGVQGAPTRSQSFGTAVLVLPISRSLKL